VHETLAAIAVPERLAANTRARISAVNFFVMIVLLFVGEKSVDFLVT
jgi:hypothetical protein